MMPTLNLSDLSAGQPGLTPALGTAMAEAGAICLSKEIRTATVQIVVRGRFQSTYELFWPSVTDQMLRTWADLREATEKGADGIGILIIKLETGFTTIERAAIGTRIDRWLGHDFDEPYFQRKARLETTGILKGDDGDINKRMREKVNRLELAPSHLPSYVVVVEFSHPLAEVEEK